MGLTRPKLHQINTSSFEINDPVIELNKNATGANTNDLGIIINRGASGDNVGILWDRSAQEFVLVETTATGASTGDLIFNSYSKLKVGELQIANLLFPTTDGTNGQVLSTDGAGNLTFTSVSGGAGTYTYTAQAAAPSSPADGDEWYDTTDGTFYKYINDGIGQQFVEWGPNNSLNGSENITANILANTTNTHDIGSPAVTLANIYATNLHGKIDGGTF